MLEAEIAQAASRDGLRFVVTSGQRLASTVRLWQAQHLQASELTSWTAPVVLTWEQFVQSCFEELTMLPEFPGPFPDVLPSAAERIYWQKALQDSTPALAAEMARTHKRATEWQLQASEIRALSNNEDTDAFVLCSERYHASLPEHVVDSISVADFLVTHGALLESRLSGQFVLAGFNRLTPQQSVFCQRFGGEVLSQPDTRWPQRRQVRVFAAPEDELRAAGQWASELIAANPDARIAIVAPGLSTDPHRTRRWVTDGLLANEHLHLEGGASSTLNVSLGESLDQVPLIAEALQWLEWSAQGGQFDRVSRINRCSSFFAQSVNLESALRNVRDRPWFAETLMAFCVDRRITAPPWLTAAATLSASANTRRLPSEWREAVSNALNDAGWFTGLTLSSELFQLREQWMRCLAELGDLDAPSGRVTLGEFVRLISMQVRDRLFSPEQSVTPVLLCGPLETTGLTFDAVWVAGLDSTGWPPPGQPLALLSSVLQRQHQMPDASPEQTREFWSTQWHRINTSTSNLVASFANFVEGRERLAAPVIAADCDESQPETSSPGALQWLGARELVRTPDGFPPLPEHSIVRGGHATLSQIGSDAFSAQVMARWAVQPPRQPECGVSAMRRGVLLHRALEVLYRDTRHLPPTHEQVAESVAQAFRGEFADAESSFRAALRAEEQRAVRIAQAFAQCDAQRLPFEVAGLEARLSVTLGDITVELRADRIDRSASGRAVIIDYKTGAGAVAAKSLSTDFDAVTQLALYSIALEPPPESIALALIHPTGIGFRGLHASGVERLPGDTGRRKSATLDELLVEWRDEAHARARRLVDGESWLNLTLKAEDWLATAPLTRFAEVRAHE